MLTVLLLVSATQLSSAYNNGYGQKPPMGWQTWCSVGPCGVDHCFDGQIRAMADTLVASGMKDLGYEWVVLDDCWHPSRDENNTLVPYPVFFPRGMRPVIDYVHSKGLKFGLYTSVGDKTCHGGWSPGSYGHYETDANTFASWGVDYVKIDYCGDHDSPQGHAEMSKALNKTGRAMFFELCRGPYQQQDGWGYAPSIAQGWRSTGDHHDNFKSVIQQVMSVKGKTKWSGPYGWAYMDMMMTGGEGCEDQRPSEHAEWNWTVPKHCPGQTDNEYRTEASFYVIVSSPLLVGTDIRLMTPIMKELLLNEEAIAINQDYTSVPGDAHAACPNGGEVWTRNLSDGTLAVAMTNWEPEKQHISICFEKFGWPYSVTAELRDVWAKRDLGSFSTNFTAEIAPHDTLLLKLSKASTGLSALVV